MIASIDHSKLYFYVKIASLVANFSYTMPHTVATRFLSALDADWSSLITQIGSCTLAPNLDAPYHALLKAVAYQQLHGRAADAIWARFMTYYQNDLPIPEALLATEDSVLRSCGFSTRKVATLKAIAQGAISNLVPSLQDAQSMSDEVLMKRLTKVSGVGQWTVQMLLIFNLGRPDVLPVGDLGIALGYQRFKNLEQMPSPQTLDQVGIAWRPYRSVASWYLWRVPKLIAC